MWYAAFQVFLVRSIGTNSIISGRVFVTVVHGTALSVV